MNAEDYQLAASIEALIDALYAGDLSYKIPRCGAVIRHAIAARLVRRTDQGVLRPITRSQTEILRSIKGAVQ